MKARQQLIDVAEDMLSRLKTGSTARAEAIMTLPASLYSDAEIFEREKRRVFRRVPLMLGASCELPKPGDFKSIDIADVPVLMLRGYDGTARAFLNGCTHRGARLAEGCGHVKRLTCPYHAWTFATDGSLLAVTSRQEFGDVDPLSNRLIEFPTTERAGLIWAILDPQADDEFDSFLQGIDEQLGGFDFAGWKHFRTRSFAGANWKFALEAQLEFYHLPVLHRESFGTQISNLAQYYYFGPHQRLGLFSRAENPLGMDDVNQLEDIPRGDWPMNKLLFGQWLVFPNVSISCFYRGGRGVLISQVFPGPAVGESLTTHIFLHERELSGDDLQQTTEMADFLSGVVAQEDLPTTRNQQKTMDSGLLSHVQFGRNEGGLQHFHDWIRYLRSKPQDIPLHSIMIQGPAAPSAFAASE